MSKSACPSILNVKRPNTYTHINQHTDLNKCIINDTHMEELDSVQKFIEKQGWLLLTFFICLHNQLSSFNSITVQMSEKHNSSSGQ